MASEKERVVIKCSENLTWTLVECLNWHEKRLNVLLQTREIHQKFKWGNNVIQTVFYGVKSIGNIIKHLRGEELEICKLIGS